MFCLSAQVGSLRRFGIREKPAPRGGLEVVAPLPVATHRNIATENGRPRGLAGRKPWNYIFFFFFLAVIFAFGSSLRCVVPPGPVCGVLTAPPAPLVPPPPAWAMASEQLPATRTAASNILSMGFLLLRAKRQETKSPQAPQFPPNHFG